MIKRIVDILISFFGLLFITPVLIPIIFLVWNQDKKSPFYIASRSGKGGSIFNMVKLRSMIANADKLGIDSTSTSDVRITPIGNKIRKYKLDEFIQLWNVLIGEMSLVGPRPNVKNETDLYTDAEKVLLTVKPGITDFSSIVFSDEGEILEGKEDPDLSYNQLIRPWKRRLGLIYIKNQSTLLDLQIIIYTAIAILSKQTALTWVANKLTKLNVDENIIKVSKREEKLFPFPPPGSDKVVSLRKIK